MVVNHPQRRAMGHWFTDDELDENSVVSKMETTAADGKNYKTNFYALQAVIAVGFKIDNERAVQFRLNKQSYMLKPSLKIIVSHKTNYLQVVLICF